MRKALIALMIVGVVAFAGVSYAHMWGGGYGGWGGGYMMRDFGGYDDKTLDETVELRKQVHDKMFELREAYRKGDEKKIEALEEEVYKLREELYKKAGTDRRYGKRHGPRMGYGGYGPGWGCGGPGGWR